MGGSVINPRLKFARAANGIGFAVAFAAYCLDMFSHIGTVELVAVGPVGVAWAVAIIVWVLCGILNIVLSFTCKTMAEVKFMLGVFLLWIGIPLILYLLILYGVAITEGALG